MGTSDHSANRFAQLVLLILNIFRESSLEILKLSSISNSWYIFTAMSVDTKSISQNFIYNFLCLLALFLPERL